MKMDIVAPLPTDLWTGQVRGTSHSWGQLTIQGYSYVVQNPTDRWGTWSFYPSPGIADADTFWGYIRENGIRDVKSPTDQRSSIDLYSNAEGTLLPRDSQVILLAHKPKMRTAMILWGFQLEKAAPGTSGQGIFYRGNTVHMYPSRIENPRRFIEQTDGRITIFQWTVLGPYQA